MTRLFNDPDDFFDEMVDGLVAANSHLIRKVHGGVVRARRAAANTVAVVTGGGSGHYPAFGGLVGEGLAHGAALGNVFASPSWQQVRSVVKSAHTGAGALLTYGNYAGDVLNFNHAQERLRASGIPTETVAVTDDISSAPPEEKHKRRGIAGDLTVLKASAAAADDGASLDEVHRIATKANERTRSFGVAFSGCTLPGANEPLFTVPEGRMAVGMGIHGEPGFDEVPLPSANDLAELLVSSLTVDVEIPEGASLDGGRVVALLNGLGSVKYEELLVVFGRVHVLLEDKGLTVVEPECGELVTSFDMAGVSLTLFWLDHELERLWAKPANAPGYKKFVADEIDDDDLNQDVPLTESFLAVPGSLESNEAGELIADLLDAIASVIDERSVELGRIDAVAGDGDHGIGMKRGSEAASRAARQALPGKPGAGAVLAIASDAWSDRAGGTSGALWGAVLEAIGDALGSQQTPTAALVAEGVSRASDAVLEFGAEVGDKTMVDALVPFAETLAREVRHGRSLTEAWLAAAAEAERAAQATAQMLPRMGRARPHAEKSLGTPDAGAVSFAFITTAVGRVLVERQHHKK